MIMSAGRLGRALIVPMGPLKVTVPEAAQLYLVDVASTVDVDGGASEVPSVLG